MPVRGRRRLPRGVEVLHRVLPHRLEQPKRRWSSGEGTRNTSDCSTRVPSAGSTSLSCRPDPRSGTASTASREKPLLNTASRSKRSTSFGSSRSMLQSSTAVGAVPFGKVARPAADRSASVASAGWSGRAAAGPGGQLERKGEAVEPAVMRPGSGVVVGRRRGRRRPPPGRAAGRRREPPPSRRRRRSAWPAGSAPPRAGAHPQRRTARRQHDEVGQRATRSASTAPPRKLLEVVEHQSTQASKVADQVVERSASAASGNPGRPRSAGRRGRAGAGVRGRPRRHLRGTPMPRGPAPRARASSADPTRPGDGDQPAAAADQRTSRSTSASRPISGVAGAVGTSSRPRGAVDSGGAAARHGRLHRPCRPRPARSRRRRCRAAVRWKPTPRPGGRAERRSSGGAAGIPAGDCGDQAGRRRRRGRGRRRGSGRCAGGRRRSPRSRAPIALAVRPDRSASSSW